MNEFTRNCFRSLTLPSNMVKGTFIFARLGTFQVSGPSQSRLTICLQEIFTRRVAMVAFGRTSLRTLTFFHLSNVAFITRMFTSLLLNVNTWKRSAALRRLLPRSPRGMKLIFLIVVPNCSVGLAIPFLRANMVSNDGVNAPRPIYPLLGGARLRRQVARRAEIQDPALAVFVCGVLCSCLSRNFTLVYRVVFGPRTIYRLTDFCQFISPRPRNRASCLVTLLLRRRTDNDAICAATRASRCSLFEYARVEGR